MRALLVEEGARVRARAERALGAARPAPGRLEQSPQAMAECARATLREALARGGAEAREVAALGIATQRSTALAWDARTGEALAPALGWQDQRTAPRAAELAERGVPVGTLASATKFEWWLRREGPVREAARAGRLRLGTPEVWLAERLTGGATFATDPGQASCTGLYAPGAEGWLEPALALFGVPAEALPPLLPTCGVRGETLRELLGAPVPVAASAGDQQAACFGQGVHARGEAKCTLGTSAMLDLHVGEGEPAGGAPPPGVALLALWRLGSGTPEARCWEASVLTAGAAVDWLAELGLLPDAAALDRLAARAPSAEGAVFVPALQGLGSPHMRPEARGFLGGLTRGTTAAHLVRACVEGLAQRVADLAEALALPEAPLRVDGGLARSRAVCAALADALGRPVERAGELETTALGAAQLAGLGAGFLPEPAACRALLPPPERFEPELRGAERRRARERWREALRRV